MHYCLNRLFIIYLLSLEVPSGPCESSSEQIFIYLLSTHVCSGPCSLMSEDIYVFTVIRSLFRPLCIIVWRPGDLLFVLLEQLCIILWKYYCSPIVYCYSVVIWITDHFVGLSPVSSHTWYKCLRHFVDEQCSKMSEKWVAEGPDMGRVNRRKRVLVDDCELHNVVAWQAWRNGERMAVLKMKCLWKNPEITCWLDGQWKLYGNGFEISTEMEMLSLGTHMKKLKRFVFVWLSSRSTAVVFFSMQINRKEENAMQDCQVYIMQVKPFSIWNWAEFW